jgi:hypothetical protein
VRLDDVQARHRPCYDTLDALDRDAAVDHPILDDCIVRHVPGDLDQ